MSGRKPPMREALSAVILAAGSGQRLGGAQKALLTLGGLPLLAWCAQSLRQAGVARLVVVARPEAVEVRALAHSLGATVADSPGRDMLASIQAGLAALADGTDAAFLLPVDTPLVLPGTLRALAQAAWSADALAAHPMHAGERGHPPLVFWRAFAALCAYSGSGGLRAALDLAVATLGPGAMLDVIVDDAGVLLDIDTPEDLSLAEQLAQERAGTKAKDARS